jgi:ABC-type multidrug transport system fused ATPase/permease subunit
VTTVHAAAVVGGSLAIAAVGSSAVRTVVLPRGDQALLTRAVFASVRGAFSGVARIGRSYEFRDRVMARFAPFALIAVAATWMAVVLFAGTLVFWGLGTGSWHTAFQLSGSSLTTLGFTQASNEWSHLAAIIEALVSLGLVALLIGYLSTTYTSFQRRELAVSLLEVRAGGPPSAVEMLLRHNSIERIDVVMELFTAWETWFVDVEETHTSQPGLAWFRSPLPGRSWITAAGAVLDGAALVTAVVDAEPSAEPQLCIRAGFLSLRRIADAFGIDYDPDPEPDDPISIDRSEFDDACRRLAEGGVPVRADLDEAWRAFNGWRVNYDEVLVALAGRLMAPTAPWSSDRSSLRARRGRTSGIGPGRRTS